MMVWMGPGRHVVTYYLRAGALLNFVGLVETDEVSEESWTAKFPWERFKADFEGWHADVQTIIDAADRDGCYRWSLHYRPAITNWSTRRATLLGDSVHPDTALSRSGRLHGDRGRRGADARAGSRRFDS